MTKLDTTSPRVKLLAEILAERDRQDEKWGQQNHPLLFHPTSREAYQKMAEAWRRVNAERIGKRNAEGAPPDRNAAWDGVLLEEVCELFGSSTLLESREELIQVIAVGFAMLEQMEENRTAAVDVARFRRLAAVRQREQLAAVPHAV